MKKAKIKSKDEQNSMFNVEVSMTRAAQYMQLDSIYFMNFYSNISYEADFRYQQGTLFYDIAVPQNQGYNYDQLIALFAGFTFNLSAGSVLKLDNVSRTNAWRPVGKSWKHYGFSDEQLEDVTLRQIQEPSGFIDIAYGHFKIKFDEFQANENVSYIVPFNGDFGEQQLYIRGSASEQICVVTDLQFGHLTFTLYDRYGYPLYCNPGHSMQIVMQLSY